jgi:dethiobiotin synthetase
MHTSFFITGTDTGVGKTFCTLALMRHFQKKNLKVVAMKPIASGCEETSQGLRNGDALLLNRRSNLKVPYEWTNPYPYLEAIAPHLAAESKGEKIRLGKIAFYYEKLREKSDVILVEGAGGWRIFLSEGKRLTDLVQLLDLPVILVVGLKLGCINHALLTAETIQRDGCKLHGWIANACDPTFESKAVIEDLQKRIDAPLLGKLNYNSPIFEQITL